MGSVATLLKKAAIETLDIWGLSDTIVTGAPVAEALDIWDNESIRDMALTFQIIAPEELQCLESQAERLEQVLATAEGRLSLREAASQWQQVAKPLHILQPAVLRMFSKRAVRLDPQLAGSLLGTVGILAVIPGGASVLQRVAAILGCTSSEAGLIMWQLAGLIAEHDQASIQRVEGCIRGTPRFSECLDKALDWIRKHWVESGGISESRCLSPEGLIRIVSEMVMNVLAAEINTSGSGFEDS